MDRKSGTPSVQSTITSMRVIDAMRDGGVGVTELANELDIHKSTAYKHLSTLEDLDCVKKIDEQYHLGPKLIQLGETTKHQHGIYTRAQSVIDQLAETTEEYVGFSLEHHHRCYNIYTARGRLALQNFTGTPHATELYSTAAGKAILSQFTQDQLDQYITATDFTAETERTITDPDELQDAIVRVQERNIAFSREEHKVGIRSVAVPYQNESLNLYGAIYVQAPADRMTGKRFNEDIPGMVNSAIEKMAKDGY